MSVDRQKEYAELLQQRKAASDRFCQILRTGVDEFVRCDLQHVLPSLVFEKLKQVIEKPSYELREFGQLQRLRTEQIVMISRVSQIFLRSAELIVSADGIGVGSQRLNLLCRQVGTRFQLQLPTWLRYYCTGLDEADSHLKQAEDDFNEQTSQLEETIELYNTEFRGLLTACGENMTGTRPASTREGLMPKEEADRYSLGAMISDWNKLHNL